MIRRLCIYTDESTGSGWIDDETAAKMMEVYDKAQEFEPVHVTRHTVVAVNDSNSCTPIHVDFAGRRGRYTLAESQKLRAALKAAEDYVESHRD